MDHRDDSFDEQFSALTGWKPFRWQQRLFRQLLDGHIPASLDLPTGLGKTSIMAIWLIARAFGAKLPRRLVYVVDRRAVVDQATEEATKLRERLERAANLKARLGLGSRALPISTLRGRFIDNREWLADPTIPAIIVGTVDMIGSRLLFSGYGVSRRMRPYHAGLLGADVLVVLDEAHLVPPFEKLLETIETGSEVFGPLAAHDRAIVPPFRLLSLSATGRGRKGDVFRLEDEDVPDVEHRLKARKTVTVVPVDGKALEDVLAEQAWLATDKGCSNARCLIYCNSREVAEKTERAIKDRADGDKKKGVAKVDVHTELFVGARRTKEREDAKDRLSIHGFLAGSAASGKPSFLVATSAGEVGVDLDADHLVCDLVPWERMVQRLGRVNRRGGRNARVVVVDEGEPEPKKAHSLTASERYDMIAYRTLTVIEALATGEQGINASPAALLELRSRAEKNKDLKDKIDAATTPVPMRPALTRSLVDAWSMTSLEDYVGRPDIGPWLRGWAEEDEPQTSLVWRMHLPVRESGDASRREIEGFFEAAPPHASELLETETWRVVDWLLDRAKALSKSGIPTVPGPERTVAFALTPAGEIKTDDGKRPLTFALSDFLPDVDAATKAREQFQHDLSGATLVVDARMGGLGAFGLLDKTEDAVARAADDGERWIEPDKDGRPAVGFLVHPPRDADVASVEANEAFVFATRRSADGKDEEVLLVETWTTEESRATSIRPQLLEEHQSWAEQQARTLATAVGLAVHHQSVLSIGARLHDEGKKAIRWQMAFHAQDRRIYAKTKGPVALARLGGYRHEFGSLPHAEKDEAFRGLGDDLRELVLHLIAAHHGFARPVIGARGCEDAPPSALEDRARSVALRFARLQKRWGPWGLAWWEALLRAADQQASRRNDEREEGADD